MKTQYTAIYYNNTTCHQWKTPLSEEWIEDTLQKILLFIIKHITQHVFKLEFTYHKTDSCHFWHFLHCSIHLSGPQCLDHNNPGVLICACLIIYITRIMHAIYNSISANLLFKKMFSSTFIAVYVKFWTCRDMPP